MTRYLDRFLQVGSIPDVPGVVNGLQHANSGRVERVVAAVDASQASIAAASQGGSVLLVVHHGLPAGAKAGRIDALRRRALRRSDVALFTCHIPLDLHPRVGNNAILGRILGLKRVRPFGKYGRRRIGVEGRRKLPVGGLVADLERLLGTSVFSVLAGPPTTKRVAVISGNGTRWMDEAARAGIDTFITGEAGHHDALYAQELGLNLLCAGHYATETVGVKALAAHLSDRFDVPWGFLDHPTGR